jgi:hypothetical protein
MESLLRKEGEWMTEGPNLASTTHRVAMNSSDKGENTSVQKILNTLEIKQYPNE